VYAGARHTPLPTPSAGGDPPLPTSGMPRGPTATTVAAAGLLVPDPGPSRRRLPLCPSLHLPSVDSLEAVLFGAVYVVCATAEVSLVKGLNYEANVVLPIFVALCLNQSWIVMLPGYVAARRTADRKDEDERRAADAREAAVLRQALLTPVAGEEDREEEEPLLLPSTSPPSPHGPAAASLLLLSPPPCPPPRPLSFFVTTYSLLGVLVFFVTLFRSHGVNYLAGSEASLLLASSVVWNLLLSRLILKRVFNRYHLASAALGVCGIATLALGRAFGTGGGPQSPSSPSSPSGLRWWLGAGSCLLAAFFVALMSVVTSKITSLVPTHKNLRVTEMTVASSFIAAVLLVPAAFATGEWREWGPQLSAAYGPGQGPSRSRTVLLTLAVFLPVAKALVRSSKYATIAHSTAFVFEFVAAAASVGSAVAQVLLFGEAFSPAILGSIAFTSAAFAVYIRAQAVGRARVVRAAAREREAAEEEAQGWADALVAPRSTLGVVIAAAEARGEAEGAKGAEGEGAAPPSGEGSSAPRPLRAYWAAPSGEGSSEGSRTR
jgi:drug/metabolite transporter (DMT)-like permease